MSKAKPTYRELEKRLAAAESIAEALKHHEVDAIVGEGQIAFLLHQKVEAAERATAAAQAQVKSIIDNTPAIVYALDLEERFLMANAALADMLHSTSEQMIGKRRHAFMPEEDADRHEANDRKVIEAGMALEFEEYSQFNGRSITWLTTKFPLRDAQGKIYAVAGHSADISDRKRVKEALSRQLAQIEAIYDSAEVGLAVFDRDLRFIRINERLAEMNGMPAQEHIGRTAREMVPGLSDQAEASLRRIVETGEPMRNVEIVGETPAQPGVRRTWVEQWVPLKDGEGRVIGINLSAIEVTQERQAHEQLKAVNAALLGANAAKDQFIAVLSHELRNPLSPVLATVALLQKDPRFDVDTCEQFEVIRRNVELEARLIDDLLDVTRIECGKVELDRRLVELGTVIRHATEVCLPEIEARKLEFGMDLGPVPRWVEADAGRLQQVFWNLIKNAIKFTPADGRVGVRCRVRDGHVIVEVHDSGEGIAPEVLPRLFSAFEQGGRPMTRQFGGLGLGLTISRAIVEMHGGSIEAYSAGKGQGSTFTVRLPMVTGESALVTGQWSLVTEQSSPFSARLASDRGPVAPEHRPLRILLVEDHGDTARIMRRLLSAQGHAVQNAADVTTALQLAGEHAFDLLLSDLGLPDGSGLDLMRSLRQRGLTLPGIAISGYGQERDLRQSREAGFAAHLTKPVNLQRLEEIIAEMAGACVAGVRTSG